MMRLIPFDFEHLDIFEQADADIARYGVITSESPLLMTQFSVGFTGIIEGRIVIVGGVTPVTEHTGKCWTLISKHAAGHGVRIVAKTKECLDSMMTDMRLHRLETSNLKEAEEHHKWCKMLGFVEEGEMPYYDDKKRTYIRFAKLRG